MLQPPTDPPPPSARDPRLVHLRQLAQLTATHPEHAPVTRLASVGVPSPQPSTPFLLRILLVFVIQLVDLINTVLGVPFVLYQIYLRFCVRFWIWRHPAVLEAAKDKQCASDSCALPSWNAVFFSIIESAAMYLRRDADVAMAALATKRGDDDRALFYLKRAQQDIDAVANALGCQFVQLCDFARLAPEGTRVLSGAFCGAFIRKDADKPFIGVAFKGTSSFIEALTDLTWHPMIPQDPNIAFGSKTHAGFYHGLFGSFDDQKKGPQHAFDMLVDQLSTIQHDRDLENARLHFTGHSLGGAYCTLAYAEFLRRDKEVSFSKFNLGDMYSLGAPRVCLLPFADEVHKLTLAGGGKYVFRIANNDDPVPMIPPPPYWLGNRYPYVHVPGGWRLTRRGPERMADEPPSVERFGLLRAIFHLPKHMLDGYYANWRKTARY